MTDLTSCKAGMTPSGTGKGAPINRLLTAVVLLLTSSSLALGDGATSLSQRSYERARQVLENGIQALGDTKRLESLGEIEVHYSATATEVGQSARPDAPYYVTHADGVRILDFVGKRSYQELHTHFLGDIPLDLKEVVTANEAFTIELGSNAVYPVAHEALAGSASAAQSFFPQYLLSAALGQTGSLRWLGEEDYDGQLQNVITFMRDGSPVALYFNAGTHLLTKYESLGDNIVFGVAAFEVIFADYRAIADVKIPFGVVTKYAGKPNTELHYTNVQVDTQPDSHMFETPKNIDLGPETGGKLALRVTKLAPDVFFVNNGLSARGNFCLNNIFFYSQLVVFFTDFVAVIEAPRSDAIAQAVIGKIKEMAPGKPIKYIALTHYHTDHLGGVRGYIASGATVLTTPGNKHLIETIATTPLPFNPDTLARNQRPLNIETFSDKRVISDSKHRVELYSIKSPHVDEMVIAYLPKEKIAFASDLAGIFAFLPKGQVLSANPSMVDFVTQVERLGLKIETVASGHGRVTTMDELRAGVARATGK